MRYAREWPRYSTFEQAPAKEDMRKGYGTRKDASNWQGSKRDSNPLTIDIEEAQDYISYGVIHSFAVLAVNHPEVAEGLTNMLRLDRGADLS